MENKVNHPSHYNHEGKKECIEEMLDTYGNVITGVFCLTNAYKYLYRMGSKDGESIKDDYDKAYWYKDFFDKRIGLVLYTDEKLALKILDLWKEVDSRLHEERYRLGDKS